MPRVRSLLIALTVALGGCANAVGPMDRPAPLVAGPPVQDVVTPYDRAVACLGGLTRTPVTISVGEIADSTGKDAISDGGQGKFITQGAGDIVQTALVKSGAVRVVNRRDPRVLITEMQWGIRAPSNIAPTDYFITGSINTLDFLPGAAAEINVGGIGPRYRQYRALVGLDLALTKASTSEVEAVSAINKQIFADEVGFNVGRFFGETLVQIDLSSQQREALQFALRGMLYYATYELLSKIFGGDACRHELDRVATPLTTEPRRPDVAGLPSP